MFTKENRVFSFIMVAMVYVLAPASALIIFWALPFHEVWLKLLVADVCATVITFIFSLIFISLGKSKDLMIVFIINSSIPSHNEKKLIISNTMNLFILS